MQVFRAALFHLLDDPADAGADACAYHDDGLLVVDDGLVVAAGPAADVQPTLPPDTPITAFPGGLIVPGFVDTHTHYPQVDVIAAHGTRLMDWLDRYTFPAEAAFADPAHAADTARFFLDELLRNGTTTALVFGTVHKGSVDALFKQALARNMRLIAGKVLMDRNAPADLLDTPDSGYADSRALIKAWHGRGRLGYAVTPRFAPTSSDRQLELAGHLLAEFDDVALHTHLSENTDEIAAVAELFPDARDYLDVYDRFGLLGDRSVFAHGIHLSDDAFARLAGAGAALAFCPTSNLFLGSGLFSLADARRHRVTVGLGTDVGGGTSFSLLQTMNEAYKVCQLRHSDLDPVTSFYLATLGGARALNLDRRIGNFLPGKEADFLVLDPAATPLLERRMAACRSLDERLFALSILGDDRVVRHTYLAGALAHSREEAR